MTNTNKWKRRGYSPKYSAGKLSWMRYKGAYEEAIDHLYKSLKIQKEIGIEYYETYVYIGKSLIHLDKDNKTISEISKLTELKSSPEAYFEYAIEGAGKDNNLETLVPALYEYGKYLYQSGKTEQGIEKLEQAKEKASEGGMKGELRKIEEICKELGVEI